MNVQSNITLIEMVSAELREMLGDDFDPDTFWDSLDGETDALDLVDRILKHRAADKALADATKAQATELSGRAKRLSERDAAHKRALHTLLNAAGEKKLERSLATVSVQKGRISVRIVNEEDVPSQLCKTTIAPDKTAIKKQIEGGEDVPGAELVRGDDTISIRVS